MFNKHIQTFVAWGAIGDTHPFMAGQQFSSCREDGCPRCMQMRLNLSFVIFLTWAISASAITIETVPVGDVGNPKNYADVNAAGQPILFGSVGYAYNIGKYEVTVGQYTAFLNAVATIDTYSLYNTSMASDVRIAGISRSGASGSYSYSVIGSANHPVTYVSWGDAARFVNWLHNGQPTGAQNASTTEDGAYKLNGATTTQTLSGFSRNVGANWFIPTADEWFKAAYYQPAAAGGDSDGYWSYPMKTNSAPYSAKPPGASAPDPTRVGNFRANDGIENGYDDGYAAIGSTDANGQNLLTDVGAYNSSPSYYGTFDQGGNVFEWTETGSGDFSQTRGGFGGSWVQSSGFLSSSVISAPYPTNEYFDWGFRVASVGVPEPSTFVLSLATFAPLAAFRRRFPCRRSYTRGNRKTEKDRHNNHVPAKEFMAAYTLAA